MELLLSLSKHTNNSIAEMLKMPFERVLAIYNALISVMDQERTAQEKQQNEALNGKNPYGNMPGLSRNPMGQMQGQVNSMMNNMKSAVPSFGSFHF